MTQVKNQIFWRYVSVLSPVDHMHAWLLCIAVSAHITKKGVVGCSEKGKQPNYKQGGAYTSRNHLYNKHK